MDVDVRYLLLILALCLCTAGCRGTDASVELLESELRWMEDQLFLMDQELSMTHAKLHSSQRFNDSLKQELDDLRRNGSDSGFSGGSSGGRPPRRDDPINDMDLSIPEIDLGAGDDSLNNGDGSQNENGTGDDAPRIDDPDSLQGIDLDETTRSKKRVDRIVLNSRLTGGYDFDGRPGDEGLLLVIEPQDKSGTYVASPGELTITVHDPTKRGEDARIAQWQYSAAESTELLRQTLLGKGFHLQLPWPNEMPEQSELAVSTTYRNPHGNYLRTRRTIRIDTGIQSVADADRAYSHDTSLVPAHRTGISRVSGVPSPPKAPTLLPVSPNQTGSGHPNWQPSRSSAVARQPRTTPKVSRQEPAWQPYR